MTSPDFAAAQQRVSTRQQARIQAQTRLESHRTLPSHHILNRLPFSLNSVGIQGAALWNQIKGREGTRPAFRVGQVDSELLDEELLQLLKAQVGDGLKLFGVGFSSLMNQRRFCS